MIEAGFGRSGDQRAECGRMSATTDHHHPARRLARSRQPVITCTAGGWWRRISYAQGWIGGIRLKAIYLCTSLAFAMLGCAQAVVQSQGLPDSLSGRWRFAMDGTTQTFSLEEIRQQPDGTFTANLTWWQYDPWCATRGLPIVGRQTDSGIAFEVPKKCNISYLVQLRREGSGWIGTASNAMRGFGLELDLKAN